MRAELSKAGGGEVEVADGVAGGGVYSEGDEEGVGVVGGDAVEGAGEGFEPFCFGAVGGEGGGGGGGGEGGGGGGGGGVGGGGGGREEWRVGGEGFWGGGGGGGGGKVSGRTLEVGPNSAVQISWMEWR